jgi:enoyl-CoA hydratase/carnithine racemase
MKPLVSAVNGWAVGAGFSLCLLTDIVIASTAARFKMSEIDVGLPCLNGTATLWPIVGRSRTVAHILLGDEISAERAKEEGIVYRVVGPGELLSTAMEIARQLAAKSPDAVREDKLWFNTLTQPLHDMSTQAAMEAHSHAFGSRAQKEGMARFKKG